MEGEKDGADRTLNSIAGLGRPLEAPVVTMTTGFSHQTASSR